VQATVTWAGGTQTHAHLVCPVTRLDQLFYYPLLTERIRTLAGQGLTVAQIAGRPARPRSAHRHLDTSSPSHSTARRAPPALYLGH